MSIVVLTTCLDGYLKSGDYTKEVVSTVVVLVVFVIAIVVAVVCKLPDFACFIRDLSELIGSKVYDVSMAVT